MARKNLFQEKTRLAISVGGVAFSVLLMIMLQGLNAGFSNILGQYLGLVSTDLWVASANTGNIMDPSFLPPTLGERLEKIDGVASARPFGMQNITTNVNGKDLAFYMIAYDSSTDAGKPLKVGEGQTTPGSGEIVIDRIVAKSNKIKIGDSITFADKKLKVVGLSEGTFILSTSFAFINKTDASAVYALPTTTNYWLVSVTPGADVQKVQAAINSQIPGVNAHIKDHFVQVNINLIRDIVTPVFGALVVLGALIGLAVIGLTIFTSTIEKAKEYGVLKAIGLKNRQLYAVVIEQALIAATLGFILGAALAYALNPLIVSAVPQFVTQLRPLDIAWIFGITVVIAIASSYIPLRRLNQIDPAEVFRS
ncbi:ABC transporter permease [Candidatus Saccharibacteria bacterium]|nr:ABC transporter permease [Candidatus Saccharibacteria bacterium]